MRLKQLYRGLYYNISLIITHYECVVFIKSLEIHFIHIWFQIFWVRIPRTPSKIFTVHVILFECGLQQWFWRPTVKFLYTKTHDRKTSPKFPEAFCRINKTHSRDLFNGRVHIIMCKHPTWLSPGSHEFLCSGSILNTQPPPTTHTLI